jgi:hypothetical protein
MKSNVRAASTILSATGSWLKSKGWLANLVYEYRLPFSVSADA